MAPVNLIFIGTPGEPCTKAKYQACKNRMPIPGTTFHHDRKISEITYSEYPKRKPLKRISSAIGFRKDRPIRRNHNGSEYGAKEVVVHKMIIISIDMIEIAGRMIHQIKAY